MSDTKPREWWISYTITEGQDCISENIEGPNTDGIL